MFSSEEEKLVNLASITLPLSNPITEELESYVLDYDGKNFIIFEPRETEEKEFKLELSENDFINYLKEKGEDPFTAQEIADNLKEEKKMASLLKLAKQENISFDTTAHLRIWVDITDLEYEKDIEDIKKTTVSLDEKIKLAKEFAKSIAMKNVYERVVDIIELGELQETYDRIDWISLLETEE